MERNLAEQPGIDGLQHRLSAVTHAQLVPGPGEAHAIVVAQFADAFASYSALLWIAPGILGGVAITSLSRHYRKRFAPDNSETCGFGINACR